MFFKVSDNPERYVNTDTIELVFFPTANTCQLEFKSGRSVKIHESTGRALLEFSETNASALDFDPNNSDAQFGRPPTPASLPLTSRIAQQLRDSAPNGMMLIDLVMTFETSDNELSTALDTLQAERVIVFIDTPSPGRYYHATNVPRITPLDHNQDSSQ